DEDKTPAANLSAVMVPLAILSPVTTLVLRVGLGKVPVKSPPASPTGFAVSALKANGTLVKGEDPNDIKLLPPVGSISTFKNLLPLEAQLAPSSEPETFVAPSPPMVVEKSPNWLVVTLRLSW